MSVLSQAELRSIKKGGDRTLRKVALDKLDAFQKLKTDTEHMEKINEHVESTAQWATREATDEHGVLHQALYNRIYHGRMNEICVQEGLRI